MTYEWKTHPHPYTLIHATIVPSVLKAYLMELNNVQPPATTIHHTSVGPSHTLEKIPKTQACTPGSRSQTLAFGTGNERELPEVETHKPES